MRLSPAARQAASISVIAILCVALVITMIPSASFAAVRYMPDVTKEMSSADYWVGKAHDPNKVLATPDQIKALNKEIYKTSSGTRDLANWSKTTFNGLEQNEANRKSLHDDGYSYAMSDIGWWWDEEKQEWSSTDAMGHIYNAIVENGVDPDATEEMAYKYAICTTRTCLQGFPTDYPLRDDPLDPDFDYLYHTMIRVGEPMLLLTRSADKKYYLALATGMSGWIPAEDIAICESRDEWLDYWHTDDVLVVYDDKIYTEDSNSTPQTANRKLPMGTRLPLAAAEDINGRIGNRTAHNNHVVWMPVRNEDGSFKKELALIGENRKVSEGYLPVTTANILKVALNQLGDTYGWGGMLSSEDCSGYMRDVYACFGLDLPRSADRTKGVLKNWSLSSMTDEEKAAFIRQLPPGTILTFSGHEMMYLGYEGDKLYVISSISNVVIPETTGATRVRGGVINTLDMLRGDGNTWLHHLNYAEVPYLDPSAPDPFIPKPTPAPQPEPQKTELSPDNTRIITGSAALTYNGETQAPDLLVLCSRHELDAGADYQVTYKNAAGETVTPVEAGEYTAVITGIGSYSGEITATFTIARAGNALDVKGKTVRAKIRAAGNKTAVKAKKLTKTVKVKAGKAYSIADPGQGTLTFAKANKAGKSKIKVNKKTGKITVKKGLKKGLYKVKVKITAAGDGNYEPLTKNVTVRIRVK